MEEVDKEGEVINAPLNIIHKLFNQNPFHDGQFGERTFFEQYCQRNTSQGVIPSLNTVPIERLPPNSLVRYRCMVQDIFDPEYYLGICSVLNTATLQTKKVISKYQDYVCNENEEVDLEKSVTMERLNLYCVPIPGLTPWDLPNQVHYEQRVDNGQGSSKKRAREDSEMGREDTVMGGEDSNRKTPNQIPKIPKETPESNSSSTPELHFDTNFPIPGASGTPALIKVYDNQEDFKLNMTIEFYGILSPPDFDEAFPDPGQPDGSSYLDFELPEERMARRPPHSLVPRIHAIFWQYLKKNPSLPPNEKDLSLKILEVQASAVQMREELLGILKRKLGGDGLAAQYLLYNLLSSVYNRASFLPLGNLPLNLFNWPREILDLPFKIGTFLSNFVPKLHSISITTQNFNLNTFRIHPVKNYLQNKLETGQLQLSSGTMLVLSEMELTSGQFSTEGLKKLNSIAQLIKWQKVAYDFQHYQADFETDMNIIILSWARSILAKDNPLCLQLPVIYHQGEDFMQHLDSISSKLRCYLSLLKETEMEQISETAQEYIQSQFVEQRQMDPAISTEDLHVWLTLARYEAMSRGEKEVKVEHWKQVMQQEQERRLRCRDYLVKLR